MEHGPGCNCTRFCKCGKYKVRESTDYPNLWYNINEVDFPYGEDFPIGENHTPNRCTRMVETEVDIDTVKDHGYPRTFLNPVTNQWESDPTDL